MKSISLRMPDDLHEKLRWLAFKERRSQHSILLEVLEKALARVTPPKGVSS
jgi:predicted transcriptional regulator